MILHNPALKRLELNYSQRATGSKVAELQSDLLDKMDGVGATRAILRVRCPLESLSAQTSSFSLEASIPLNTKDQIAFFGFNSPGRLSSNHHEIKTTEGSFLDQVCGAPRRNNSVDYTLLQITLGDRKIAEEISQLYSSTFHSFPEALDVQGVLEIMKPNENHPIPPIAYAVISEDRILSVLFGKIYVFGDRHAVELIYSATHPSVRGNGMTLALANAIRKDVEQQFRNPIIFAETLAAPVMRSCHDFGMNYVGFLPEHTHIETFSSSGINKFTNLYVWSL